MNEHTTTASVLNALNLRYLGGTTNTASAIRLARISMFTADHGDRVDAVNVIILLTDGNSNNRLGPFCYIAHMYSKYI